MGDSWWVQSLLYIGGLWVFMAVAGLLPQMLIRFSKFKPLRDDAAERAFTQAYEHVDSAWLEAEGFTPVAALRVPGAMVVGWEHLSEPIYIAVTVIQKTVAVDVVSVFEGDHGLTTGNVKGGALIPPDPGSFMQVFPRRDIEQLWRSHLQAEALLREYPGHRSATTTDFVADFERGVKAQMSWLLARPWLWLLIPWWYFVRQHRWSNISIHDQIQRGWIDPEVPHDAERRAGAA